MAIPAISGQARKRQPYSQDKNMGLLRKKATAPKTMSLQIFPLSRLSVIARTLASVAIPIVLSVIANQCAHWCGNPLRTREQPSGDCHGFLRNPRNDTPFVGRGHKNQGAIATGNRFILIRCAEHHPADPVTSPTNLRPSRRGGFPVPPSTHQPLSAPTISTVINQMKGVISKRIGVSVWQKGFYDHVIRGERDYQEIWNFIEGNPYSWTEDELCDEKIR